MLNIIISLSIFVLCVNLWIVMNKVLKYYANEIDPAVVVHLYMLLVTITLPFYYDNEVYLDWFISTLIPALMLFILYILYCLYCVKKERLNENRHLMDFSEKCKNVSNNYPERIETEHELSYYKNDKNFKKSEAFLQTKQFNKEISKILNEPLERLKASKKSLEDKEKAEISQIIKRKIGYEYELAIYNIFNIFEEKAIKDDIICEVKKAYEIEEVFIAKKIINGWRDIEEYLVEINKINYLGKEIEAKIIKGIWSTASKPTQIELLASIKEYYNINEMNALKILEKWEENLLVKKESHTLNYDDILRIFGENKLSDRFIRDNLPYTESPKYSIGPTLSIKKLELRNKSLKLPYGTIVEFCGGDSNRITNMDLTFKQWKIIKRYKQEIYLIFKSLKANYREHLNEFERGIFVTQIVTEYQLRNDRKDYEFFIDIWLRNGLIKKIQYSDNHEPSTTTYQISELLKSY